MNQPETIPVPLNVVEGVINYLATRPYKEVAEGIAHLHQAVRQAQEKRERLDKPLDPAQQRAVDGVLQRLGDPEE